LPVFLLAGLLPAGFLAACLPTCLFSYMPTCLHACLNVWLAGYLHALSAVWLARWLPGCPLAG